MFLTIILGLGCTATSDATGSDDTAAATADDTGPPDAAGVNPCLDFWSGQPTEGVLDGLEPAVVCTWPRSGDLMVDPALDELTVVFSQDMSAGGYAWVTRGDAESPEGTGDPEWLDARTQVLGVALEPDTVYGLWLNLGKYDSFRSESNVPSAPYPLYFKTGTE